MTDFNNNTDVIDSRDVIARIEELESDLETVHEDDTEAGCTSLDFEEWLKETSKDDTHAQHDEAYELVKLRELRDEADCSPDWNYGEQLISRDYFVEYIIQLIDECYPMPEGVKNGDWPYRHMEMDYEGAAREAEEDYMSVDFDGNEYLIRA